MTNDIPNLLGQSPIFSMLEREARDRLAREVISRDYREGEWIAYNGDIWPYLFIIEKGVITAQKESSEGRSLLAAQFVPGDIFWGLAFFIEGAPTPAGLVSSSASRIHFWSRDLLQPILMENGQMSWELTQLMVRRMLLASKIVEGLAFQPVAGRLASWLLERYQETVGDFVARDVTLDEMAAHIGTTREMVCRALYQFAEEGAVQLNRTELMISDPIILQKYTAKEK